MKKISSDNNSFEKNKNLDLYILSNLERDILDLSLKDYENGDYSTHEELKTKVKKRLEKK